MKKIIPFLLFVILATACKKQAQPLFIQTSPQEQLMAGPSAGNTWTLQGYSPAIGRREGMASFVINTKAYVFGGYDISTSSYKKDLWEYNSVTNVWSQKASFPFDALERREAVGFAINGKGYIATGRFGLNKMKDLWEFDPTASNGYGSWTRKAELPGPARYQAVGFAINGKGYIATGAYSNFLKDIWEYDPVADAWTQKADLPGEARADAFVFVCNNKAYIGCGFRSDSFGGKELWEYNPATNGWIQKANYPGQATQGLFAYSNGYSGYAGTGIFSDWEGYVYTKDFWKYSPLIDSWAKKKDFAGYQRQHAVAFYVNSKGFAGFGTHPVYVTTNDLFRYTPEIN